MPTASASISASSRVVDMIGTTPAAITMSRIAAPAPIRALMTGMIAAQTEPSVMMSTMIAMPTPMASMADTWGMANEKRSPPT